MIAHSLLVTTHRDNLDGRKVRNSSGKIPGKKCGGGYISASFKCRKNRGKGGKLNQAGKASSQELAAKVRAAKGLKPLGSSKKASYPPGYPKKILGVGQPDYTEQSLSKMSDDDLIKKGRELFAKEYDYRLRKAAVITVGMQETRGDRQHQLKGLRAKVDKIVKENDFLAVEDAYAGSDKLSNKRIREAQERWSGFIDRYGYTLRDTDAELKEAMSEGWLSKGELASAAYRFLADKVRPRESWMKSKNERDRGTDWSKKLVKDVSLAENNARKKYAKARKKAIDIDREIDQKKEELNAKYGKTGRVRSNSSLYRSIRELERKSNLLEEAAVALEDKIANATGNYTGTREGLYRFASRSRDY